MTRVIYAEFVLKPNYPRETIVIYSAEYLHYPRLVHILYECISVYCIHFKRLVYMVMLPL